MIKVKIESLFMEWNKHKQQMTIKKFKTGQVKLSKFYQKRVKVFSGHLNLKIQPGGKERSSGCAYEYGMRWKNI